MKQLFRHEKHLIATYLVPMHIPTEREREREREIERERERESG